MQTFNNYFKSAVGKLGIKECEVSSDANANSRSKDGVDVAIEKYKDHPSINMTKKYGNLIYKKRFLILTPIKLGLSEMFLRKYLRILPIFVIQYFKIYGNMRY